MTVRGIPLAGERFTGSESAAVTSPYDGKEIGRVPVCGPDDVDRAVGVAKAALAGGPLPRWKRAEVLDTAARLLAERRDEFAEIIAKEAAKPIKTARVEAERAVGTFQFAAAEARTLAGDVVALDAIPTGVGKVGFTMRVPIGVVGAISPFNFPLNLVAHKLAPAIAAGCPVVLKPASQTPFSGIALAELLIDECGLPAEWLHVVTGGGSTVGNAIVDHDDIALITFTGSPDVGWGDQGEGAAEEGRSRARQQRAGDHRGRQRLDDGGGEDQGRRVLPRRAELHLDAAHLRPRRHRRCVRRDARQGGVVARRRRPDGRVDRRVGADLRGRARPRVVVGGGGRRRRARRWPTAASSTTTACCCRPC